MASLIALCKGHTWILRSVCYPETLDLQWPIYLYKYTASSQILQERALAPHCILLATVIPSPGGFHQ